MIPISDTVFNVNKTDYTGTKSLFLGQPNGLFDSINKSHPAIWELYKKMKSLDWDENEFPYADCALEFKTCSRSVYEMMIKTLAWQWEADSLAAHNLIPIVAPFVSSSELWALYCQIGNNECLTSDHEVLTNYGWKRIDEIAVDDKVAQWDYTTRGISFIKPERIIKERYNGLLYCFSDNNGNVSQITTAKHRLPVIYPYWTNESQPECRFAEEVKFHGGNGLPTSGYLTSGGRHMTPQERLYVAVQADGSLCSDNYDGSRSGHRHYRFGLKKQRKIDRLYYLCQLANWNITELNTSDREKEGIRTFIIFVPNSEYNKEAKTFDWFNLDEISYEWAMDFLDEIQYWDGNKTLNGNIRYINSNKSCIDKVSILTHLTGQRGHITVIPPRSGVLMPNGKYSNTKESYQVHISQRPYVAGNSIVKSAFEYTGDVYCLTVSTGYFLIRHNGAISVTGNCLHALTYSEIVRNTFENPDAVMKEILEESEALRRMRVVANAMAEVKAVGLKLQTGEIQKDDPAARDAIMLFVFTLLGLERIQFMPSFGVTFAIAESGMFLPIGQAVKKICADELNIHVEAGKAIISNELQTPEGQASFNRIKPRVQQIYDEITRSELRWCNYMFSDGRELVGMNLELLENWTLFNANDVYTFTKIENPFKIIRKNPIPFINDWIDLNNHQASPQEEKPSNYLLGGLVNDAGDKVYDFDL